MQKKKTRKLCFNFRRIHKKEVYQAFLDIYAHGVLNLLTKILSPSSPDTPILAVRPVSRRFSTVISSRFTSEFTRVYKLLIQGSSFFRIFVTTFETPPLSNNMMSKKKKKPAEEGGEKKEHKKNYDRVSRGT